MVTILNTSILTTYGAFTYTQITLDQVKGLISRNKWQSAVGHQSTCDILTELLGVDVPMNRIEYKQKIGDIAIVFKLKKRAPEGVIYTKEQILEIGFEFGLLLNLPDTSLF